MLLNISIMKGKPFWKKACNVRTHGLHLFTYPYWFGVGFCVNTSLCSAWKWYVFNVSHFLWSFWISSSCQQNATLRNHECIELQLNPLKWSRYSCYCGWSEPQVHIAVLSAVLPRWLQETFWSYGPIFSLLISYPHTSSPGLFSPKGWHAKKPVSYTLLFHI